MIFRYAISVYDNRHLESLWTPKGFNVSIERGNLFFQDNPVLCPHVIYELQSQFRTKDNRNVTGDISEQSNGNRGACKCDLESFASLLQVKYMQSEIYIYIYKYFLTEVCVVSSI